MAHADARTPLNALVVDDHPLVARGMADFLVSHCGVDQVDLVASSEACLRHIVPWGAPRLVVVDFWLPCGTAAALLGEIARTQPQTRLLVVSGDDQPAVQARVRAAGAHGFVRKSEPPEVFGRAVAALLRGATWFERATPPGGATQRPGSLPVRAADLGLTQRQGEVLAMMLRGHPNKHIARALHVTEATVKEHVTGILARLGVANRVEAIMLLGGTSLES